MKNKFYRRSRISPKRFKSIIKRFAEDKTATETARLTRVSIRSMNSIYLKLRHRLVEYCDQQWVDIKSHAKDDVKVSRRPIERPCQQSGQKIIVLVLSQYQNHIHLEVVPDARKSQVTRSRHVKTLSIGAPDKTAQRFWQFLEHRLIRFRGISEVTFHMHIKETAFRFNYKDDLYNKLLVMLEQKPL